MIGLILLVVSVGAFQIMLDTGREHDWFGSAWIVGLAVVAAISFAAFVIWELTDANPVVNLRIFRFRGFTFATMAISLGFGAFFAQVVLTPLWLQQVAGYTATDTGFIVAWLGVFAVLLSPVAAGLMTKVDVRITICGGILWMAFDVDPARELERRCRLLDARAAALSCRNRHALLLRRADRARARVPGARAAPGRRPPA